MEMLVPAACLARYNLLFVLPPHRGAMSDVALGPGPLTTRGEPFSGTEVQVQWWDHASGRRCLVRGYLVADLPFGKIIIEYAKDCTVEIGSPHTWGFVSGIPWRT